MCLLSLLKQTGFISDYMCLLIVSHINRVDMKSSHIIDQW